MLELLAVLAIVATLDMLAITSVNRSTLNLSSAEQDFMANLRIARANANGRGVHFRVTIGTSSYKGV
jgi:Tfp pilus assembly protein FimT